MDKITKSKIVLRIMLKPLDPLSKKREDAERKSKGKEEGEIIKRARDLVKMGSLEENVILLFYRELLSFSDKNLREKKEAASMMRKKLIDIIFNSYFLSFIQEEIKNIDTNKASLFLSNDYFDDSNLDSDFDSLFEFLDHCFIDAIMKKEIDSYDVNYENIKDMAEEQEETNQDFDENDYWGNVLWLVVSVIVDKWIFENDDNENDENNNFIESIFNRKKIECEIWDDLLKIIESNNEKFTRFLVNKHPKILVIANLFSKKEIKKTIESFIYLRNLNIDEEYMFSGVFDKVSHLEKILDINI